MRYNEARLLQNQRNGVMAHHSMQKLNVAVWPIDVRSETVQCWAISGFYPLNSGIEIGRNFFQILDSGSP